MSLVCQNKTYLYFQPINFLNCVFCRHTDKKIFEEIELEQLEKILAIQREIIRNLFSLDGDFKVRFDGYESSLLFELTSDILAKSDDANIIQRVIQWISRFKDGDETVVLDGINMPCIATCLEHFVEIGLQIKLNDVYCLLALCFKPDQESKELELNFADFAKLLGYALACCSDDMSKNKSKLDLDLVLNIWQENGLVFYVCDGFHKLFEFLAINMEKISFRDNFIKKVFNSKINRYNAYVPSETWLCCRLYDLLDSSSNVAKKKLISIKTVIDFMLRNSLTKTTKKAGDNFVESLAEFITINKFGDGNEKDKLAAEFVFNILKDNKMADRAKLFINTLAPELRPEITNINHEQEPENSKVDENESNIQEKSRLDNTEANPDFNVNVNINSGELHDGAKQDGKENYQKDGNNSGSLWKCLKMWLYLIFVRPFVKLYFYLPKLLRKTDVKTAESTVLSVNQSISDKIKEVNNGLSQSGFVPKIENENEIIQHKQL